MIKYVLYGAGQYGKRVLSWLPIDKVAFFIDGNPKVQGTYVEGVPVYGVEDKLDELGDCQIIISVKKDTQKEIEDKLIGLGIRKYLKYQEFEKRIIEERLSVSVENIEIYKRAIHWIKNNSIKNEGIINNTGLKESYPEVTGYYIPSMMYWGYRGLAMEYAKWLCSIQQDDGSFLGTNDGKPYIFDTAQIIKGLLAVRHLDSDIDKHIINACDFILRYVDESGRLVACDESVWGDGKMLSELIHIYCLSPLVEAGKIFGKDIYCETAKRILEYYIDNEYDKIMDFHLLSHFYAYVIEGLIDMGQIDIARDAMKKIERYQDESGAVPAYKEVSWTCSTGLFQFAIIWYRLGDICHAEKAFNYACKLQNESGGWYGGYLSLNNTEETVGYFASDEISWANKYFLDALRYRAKAIFDTRGEFFIDHVDRDSSTYRSVYDAINSIKETNEKKLKIADVGCGRGSYLKNLIEDFPEEDYYAIDISEKVMGYFDDNKISKHIGSLTCIPFEDSFFDITYACESLEHAVEINNSIKEMARVTKPGGTILVIDKHMDTMGEYVIEEWEQFFDEEELKNVMETYCTSVHIEHGIGHTPDSMVMSCWVGEVK